MLRIASMLVGLCFVSGCVAVIDEVYYESERVEEPSLCGNWQIDDLLWPEDPRAFSVERIDNAKYRFSGSTPLNGGFDAVLFRIGDRIYAECSPHKQGVGADSNSIEVTPATVAIRYLLGIVISADGKSMEIRKIDGAKVRRLAQRDGSVGLMNYGPLGLVLVVSGSKEHVRAAVLDAAVLGHVESRIRKKGQ